MIGLEAQGNDKNNSCSPLKHARGTMATKKELLRQGHGGTEQSGDGDSDKIL